VPATMRYLPTVRDSWSCLRIWMVCSVLAAGCGGGTPTSPDRSPNTSLPPNALLLISWQFDFASGTTTTRAQAGWTLGEPPISRDVTSDAVWASSDSTIARIAGPGQVSSGRPGDAVIAVAFRGITSTQLVRVYQGESPLPVMMGAIGHVLDGSLPPPGNRVTGATVEILSGHNAGRTAITDSGGIFTFDGPFICGPSTIRASKVGYGEMTEPRMWCVDAPQPELVLTPQ